MDGRTGANDRGEALQRLKRHLNELRTLASRPPLDDMADDLRADGSVYSRFPRVPISKATFSRYFANPDPRVGPHLLRMIVEYLAKEAREGVALDPDKLWEHFFHLYRDALDRPVPSGPGPDDDSDDPDAGANPARPGPPGPRSSGGGARTRHSGAGGWPPYSLHDVLDDLRSTGGCRHCGNPHLLVDLTRTLADRTLRCWSDALALHSAPVAFMPTSNELRELVARTLDRPSNTAILWLRAPVVWDQETGEPHFLTRDSEFDDFGTLWNSVAYTEIQYAIARSAAKSVFVVVLAGRDPRTTCATVPVARTPWADTLYADDGPASYDSDSPRVFLLWLKESTDAGYSEALFRTLLAKVPRDVTTASFAADLRALNERFGLPAPYAAARNGGEEIEIRKSPQPRFVLRPGGEDLDELAREFLRVRPKVGPNAYLPHQPVTAIAMGLVRGVDVIVAARTDGTLQLWDPYTGELIQTLCENLPTVTALAIGRTAGRDFIVAESQDQSLVTWEVLEP